MIPALALRVCERVKSLRSPYGSTQRTRGNDVSIAASKDESDQKARRILALARFADLSKSAYCPRTEVLGGAKLSSKGQSEV